MPYTRAKRHLTDRILVCQVERMAEKVGDTHSHSHNHTHICLCIYAYIHIDMHVYVSGRSRNTIVLITSIWKNSDKCKYIDLHVIIYFNGLYTLFNTKASHWVFSMPSFLCYQQLLTCSLVNFLPSKGRLTVTIHGRQDQLWCYLFYVFHVQLSYEICSVHVTRILRKYRYTL